MTLTGGEGGAYDNEEEEEEEDLLHPGPLEDLIAEGGRHPLLHPLLVVLVQVVETNHLQIDSDRNMSKGLFHEIRIFSQLVG